MAKEKKLDENINHWMSEIRAGEKYAKKYFESEQWKIHRQMYRGDWAEDIVPVNRMFSYGRSMIPRVYFRSPRVCVTATRPELVPHAIVVEAVDNWLIKETRLKHTLKTASMHSFLSGYAPIKLGFDSEFGYNPTQATDEEGSTVTQIATNENRKVEYNVNVKPGMPWALPLMPEDVIIPWGYKDPYTLPWIAHRIYRPIEDIKRDQKYRNTSKLEGTRRIDASSNERRSVFSEGKEIQLGELYEIRDLQRNEVLVICENTLLLKAHDALQIEGSNYEFVIFNEDPEFFCGIPDARILKPQCLELNEVRTQSQRHRRIALLKFLYQKGTVKKEALEEFLSGKVGPAIAIDSENIMSAIVTLQPHMPPELWQEAQVIMNDLRESIGYSENQVGSYARKGANVSATETAEVAESADIRVDERKDIMADVLSNIIRKWNQYIFSFWTGERVQRIVGPEGGQFWVRFTGDELRGEYALNVDPESGFPISSAMKRQLADNLLKQYGGDPLINQILLRKQHLMQYESVSPGITGLIQEPQPMNPADMAAGERQPSPMGAGAGNKAGSNQGGGARGFSPDNPMQFQEFKEKMGG